MPRILWRGASELTPSPNPSKTTPIMKIEKQNKRMTRELRCQPSKQARFSTTCPSRTSGVVNSGRMLGHKASKMKRASSRILWPPGTKERKRWLRQPLRTQIQVIRECHPSNQPPPPSTGSSLATKAKLK